MRRPALRPPSPSNGSSPTYRSLRRNRWKTLSELTCCLFSLARTSTGFARRRAVQRAARGLYQIQPRMLRPLFPPPQVPNVGVSAAFLSTTANNVSRHHRAPSRDPLRTPPLSSSRRSQEPASQAPETYARTEGDVATSSRCRLRCLLRRADRELGTSTGNASRAYSSTKYKPGAAPFRLVVRAWNRPSQSTWIRRVTLCPLQ